LYSAAGNGFVFTVQHLLLDGRADPAALNSYAFRLAVCGAHVDVVKALLADGRTDPSTVWFFTPRKDRPLFIARWVCRSPRSINAVECCLESHARWVRRCPWLRVGARHERQQ
jgi:hypothetical protein